MLVSAKNQLGYEIFEKIFKVSIRKSQLSQLKIDFRPVLTFSRVPEAAGEFYPFNFSLLRLGGGIFSCWCGIQEDWGRHPPPATFPPCQGMNITKILMRH